MKIELKSSEINKELILELVEFMRNHNEIELNVFVEDLPEELYSNGTNTIFESYFEYGEGNMHYFNKKFFNSIDLEV